MNYEQILFILGIPVGLIVLWGGLKFIMYLCFLGNLDIARKKLPGLMYVLDNLMHLHLKTKIGRAIHKAIVVNTYKFDHMLPIFEVGYYCIAMRKGDDK